MEHVDSDDYQVIFPKYLPERDVSHKADDNGFTNAEKSALRMAWTLIEPFHRRYGKDIFYSFLTQNECLIDSFRHNRKINLECLHRHAVAMMQLLGRLIHKLNAALEFRAALEESMPKHSTAIFGLQEIHMLAEAMKEYLIKSPVLHGHVSPTFINAISRLFNIIGNYNNYRMSQFFEPVRTNPLETNALFKDENERELKDQ